MKKGIIFIALIISLASCSKDTATVNSNNTPVSSVTVNNFAADTIIGLTPQGIPFGAGKYSFYSLETNKSVPSSDSATTKWDLGFRGTSIIINGGNSGPGMGSGFVFVGLYNNLSTIPADSTFKVDNAPTSYAITAGSNRGWFVYDAINNLVNPIPGRVLVIRTASGKYAKVEILSYYKGGVTPPASASDAIKLNEQRYYTFRFTYQPNGTKNF
ncbi:MAG: hypothetical protein EAZ12_00785 [Sphingobacteriia bacterium]|nr:MAG: hypothetical protein EAZ12_00785 [Sphingobacteriia bacterium]